jgi:zinc protease
MSSIARSRPLHLTLWALLTVLLVAPVTARELADEDIWPQQKSDLKPDPTAVFGKLDNGMRYVLMPNDRPKDRISLRLLVGAGSLMETPEQRGLAHFLEHMAFKGSQNLPAGDLVQYLERLGMAFGADTNARTSFESTVYQLELPNNTPAMIGKSLMVMRETADRLLILTAELDKERGVILSEKRLRDTPDYRGYVANLSFLLPDTLITKRFPIGEEEVISNTPRERMVDFYRAWYRPERLTLVAVGHFDMKQMTQAIHERFDSLRAQEPARPNPELGSIAPRGPSAQIYSDPDGQTRVSLQTVVYTDSGADTRATRAEDIALYLANGVISRRLTSISLQGNSSILNGSAQWSDLVRFVRVGSVSVQCKPEQWKAALATAEQELRRALQYGFTAPELEEQKKNLASYFEQQAKSAATRESPELANEITDHISNFEVFTDPAYDLAEFQRILPLMTPQKALAALRELWKDAGPLVFVNGAVSLPDPQPEILEALKVSQAQPVTKPANGGQDKFAYTNFGKPSTVAEKKKAILDVEQIRFGNNVRLNLKRTAYEANTILVGVRFGGGRLQLPADKPGLKVLADNAFVSGGLGKHSLDELNRIIAGRNIGLEFTVDDDAFVFTGRTTPGDLLLQLQVIAAYFTDAGYRPEALQRFRQGLEALYLNLNRTPSGVMQSQVSRYIHSDDPRFGYPPRADVEARTLEELKAWLTPALKQGYLEISLVGDFDPKAAEQAVGATFGSLPTREAAKPPYTAQREVKFPSARELKSFDFQSRDAKAYAVVYWPTTDFAHVSEVRRLFVLAKILEGRVLDRIRGNQGQSYAVQSAHAPSNAFPGYGTLLTLVDASPITAQKLALQIREIAGEMANQGITQDELERARNPIVNELKKLLMDNNYLMTAVVGASQEQPQRLQRATTSVKELESLTVEQVQAVAKQYLQAADGLPVVVVPVNGVEKKTEVPAVSEAAGVR